MRATVMIPAYNAGRFLSETLESAVNQTFQGSYEVLVVNDGSTDDTPDILRYYASKFPFIRVLSQENQGSSAARNTLLRHASGEVLFGLDADDILDARALEVVLGVFNRFPSVNHIYTDQEEIDEEGNFLWDRKRVKVHRFIDDLTYHCHFQGHLKAFKKNLVKKTRFNEDLRSAVDWDFFLRLFPKADILHVPKVLYSYRINSKGISVSRREEVIRNSINLVTTHVTRRGTYGKKEFQVVPVNAGQNIHYYDHIIDGESTMKPEARLALERYLRTGE